MRILLVTTGLALGGAERQVVDLANRLTDRGHDVAIAYLVGDATLRPDPRVTLFPLRFSKLPVGLLRGCLRLGRLVRCWKPDVVHSHMVHANLLTRLVRLACPMTRLICTAHNTSEGGRWVSFAYRLTDRLADVSTNAGAVQEPGAPERRAARVAVGGAVGGTEEPCRFVAGLREVLAAASECQVVDCGRWPSAVYLATAVRQSRASGAGEVSRCALGCSGSDAGG